MGTGAAQLLSPLPRRHDDSIWPSCPSSTYPTGWCFGRARPLQALEAALLSTNIELVRRALQVLAVVGTRQEIQKIKTLAYQLSIYEDEHEALTENLCDEAQEQINNIIDACVELTNINNKINTEINVYNQLNI